MASALVGHSALPSKSWCCSKSTYPVPLFLLLLRCLSICWLVVGFDAVSPSFGWSSFWPWSMCVCIQECLRVSMISHPFYMAKEFHSFFGLWAQRWLGKDPVFGVFFRSWFCPIVSLLCTSSQKLYKSRDSAPYNGIDCTRTILVVRGMSLAVQIGVSELLPELF